MKDLPMLYLITGVFSIFFGPLSGKISDKYGKFKVFVVGSIISMIMVAIYTHLGITPLWMVIAINVVMFAGITARMISASTLMSAIPQVNDRGAFMSINSSIQQISGGVASALAGMIVSQASSGMMLHYDLLGYTVVGSMLIAIAMMYVLDKHLRKNAKKG